MDIAAQIRDQIETKRAELLKLESALEVVESLTGKQAAGKGTPARQALFTVRKVAQIEPLKKSKGGGRPVKDINWRETVQNVLGAADHPLRAGEIIKALGLKGKEGQRVYGSLNYLVAKDAVARSEGGYYTLVRPNRGGSGESPKADDSLSSSAQAA